MHEPAEAHPLIIASDPSAATRPSYWGWGALLALVAVGLKAGLLAADAFPFNADESVVALMARHILQGARPAFFYGQSYMGSLDAFLVAAAFKILGEGVLPIRIVQALLYAGTVTTTVALAGEAVGTRRAAILAGLLAAVPAVNVTLYTTVSLGGYGEALLIGNALFLVTLRIARRPTRILPVVVWGLLAGLGFWAFGLVAVYALPALVFVTASLVRGLERRALFGRAAILVASASVGAIPWLLQAVGDGPAELLRELGGSAIAGVSGGSLAAVLGSHVSNLLVFGSTALFGLRPPWEVRWLALPLLPLVFGFWLLVLARVPASVRRRDGGLTARRLLAGMVATLLLGFVFSPFGADPSGRYFLPLSIPLAVFAADLLESIRPRLPGAWAAALVSVVVGYNLWGTVETARSNPPGLTTQFDRVTWIDHRYDAALMDFLEANGAERGYTNYWVAYPLAFLSEEQLIFVPRLPYHTDFRYTPRDDRYAPYDEAVAGSPSVAYITTSHPGLDARLRTAFAGLGVAYREQRIGDYQVFYALSSPIRPEALDLAEAP